MIDIFALQRLLSSVRQVYHIRKQRPIATLQNDGIQRIGHQTKGHPDSNIFEQAQADRVLEVFFSSSSRHDASPSNPTNSLLGSPLSTPQCFRLSLRQVKGPIRNSNFHRCGQITADRSLEANCNYSESFVAIYRCRKKASRRQAIYRVKKTSTFPSRL